MAGERLAKLTIEASFPLEDGVRGQQTEHVAFRLAGAWIDYYRGAYTSQHQFIVPDPDDEGRDYVKKAVENLLALIQLDIQARGLPYTVSAARDLGNSIFTNAPRIQFDIEATQYDGQLDLDFRDYYAGSPKGWTVVTNLSTLQPLDVYPLVTAATSYNAADGSIHLTVIGHNASTAYTYAWQDPGAPLSGDRTGLKRGTYTCVVSDGSGVSTTVVCVVTSDQPLAVEVQQTATSITLVPSGGLAPYTVQYDDGSTDFVRTGLAPGTYPATVTDARGATVRVVVTLALNRSYWSQNPVRFDFDAGQAYRDDPTTKPNLSYQLEVWVEVEYLSGLFEQVGPELEQPVDKQGRTTFDVSSLLDAFLQEHLPALSGNVVERADSLFRRFYVKSSEKYGTPPVPAPVSTAEQQYVLLGGLPDEVDAAGTWAAYQRASLPFLTWEPDYQKVLPAQPVYLYYQHLAATDSFQVCRRQRTVGNVSHPTEVLATQADVRRLEVYCLRVPPPPAPGLLGYDVWVQDAAGVLLSAVRHYQLDRAYYPQQRFVHYTNSLGGVNVLAAVGQAKLAVEVTTVEANRPAYVPGLGDVAVLDRQGTPTLSIVSGPRLRKQVYADQELLLSRRVTLLSQGQYWPGKVAAATYTVKDEAEGLASVSFDFVLPKQRHFGAVLPTVLAGQPLTPIAGGEGAQP